jgi:hypothetical protein
MSMNLIVVFLMNRTEKDEHELNYDTTSEC